MKWFRVYLGQIEPVDVIRETEQFIFIRNSYNGNEERTLKRGRSRWAADYFPSFTEAKQYLIDSYQEHYSAAVREMTRLAGKLREAGALQEPK